MDPVIETLIVVIRDNSDSAVYGIQLTTEVIERTIELLIEYSRYIAAPPPIEVKQITHGLGFGHSGSIEIGKELVVDQPRFGWTPDRS